MQRSKDNLKTRPNAVVTRRSHRTVRRALVDWRGRHGEVYRARDARLGRDVAIKSLPDLALADPERITRFEREAQILASLNHPHVGGIYGLEESSGSRFLILELVEGEILAARLRLGPPPLKDALTIARQIADALQAAHDKGIIHRDLKPANIMINAEGQAKILDFGLANRAGAGGSVHHVPAVVVVPLEMWNLE